MQNKVQLTHMNRALITPGERLPALSLPSTDGDQVNLGQVMQDSHVVLFFYPGDREGLRYAELSGCTAEACSFRNLIHTFRSLGAAVFGISLQPTERQREFVEREHLNFPLLSDGGEALCQALGIPIWVSDQGERFAMRTTIVVERGGTVAQVMAPKDVSGHVEEVLAAVRTLPTVLFQHGSLRVLQSETVYVQAAGSEGASVLVATPDGRLLVAREYRPAVRQEVWGLPGGMLLPGETPEEGARRELREEFGAEVGELHYLGAVYPQPGVLDRLVHLFFARLESLGESQPEADEQIRPTPIPAAELDRRLLAGDAADAELPCAILFAKLRGVL